MFTSSHPDRMGHVTITTRGGHLLISDDMLESEFRHVITRQGVTIYHGAIGSNHDLIGRLPSGETVARFRYVS